MYGSVTLQTVMPPDFKIFNTFSLFVVFVIAEMSRTTHSDILCVFLLSSSRFGTLEADDRALLLRFIYSWDPQGQKNENFDDVAVRDVSLGEARLQGLPLDLD